MVPVEILFPGCMAAALVPDILRTPGVTSLLPKTQTCPSIHEDMGVLGVVMSTRRGGFVFIACDGTDQVT